MSIRRFVPIYSQSLSKQSPSHTSSYNTLKPYKQSRTVSAVQIKSHMLDDYCDTTTSMTYKNHEVERMLSSISTSHFIPLAQASIRTNKKRNSQIHEPARKSQTHEPARKPQTHEPARKSQTHEPNTKSESIPLKKMKIQKHFEETLQTIQLKTLNSKRSIDLEPVQDTKYFNFFADKRITDKLSPDTDPETKLEAIYYFLKDQLRKAQKDLINEKQRSKQQKQVLTLKKIAGWGSLKSDKNIASTVEQVVNGTLENVPSKISRVIQELIKPENRQHARYYPCCKKYDQGGTLTAKQFGEFCEWARQAKTCDKGNELSNEDKRTVKRFIQVLRSLQMQEFMQHDCKRSNLVNDREVIKMRIEAIKQPKPEQDIAISAGQFSQRDVAVQSNQEQVPYGTIPQQRCGFKTTKDVSTSVEVQLHQQQDWFYSDINRQMMRDFYTRHGLKMDTKIEEKFAEYDWMRHQSLQQLNQRLNFQDGTKCITEAELTYLIATVNSESDLQEIHKKACYTAKVLTLEMIEGKVPIQLLINQNSTVSLEVVKTLLFRIQKLYFARGEVRKILKLILFVFDFGKGTELHLRRLKTLLNQFQTENHIYHKSFLYQDEDIHKRIHDALIQLGCESEYHPVKEKVVKLPFLDYVSEAPTQLDPRKHSVKSTTVMHQGKLVTRARLV